MAGKLRVIVIGAGAFGGWSALMLRRAGAEVLLVDAWGPGHARASSGGPTRVLRLSYPSRVFHPIGLLWMAPRFDVPERAVMTNLQTEGVPFDRLDGRALAATYPQIRTDDLEGAIFEPGAGYLLAAEACRAVVEPLVAEGGTYRSAWAEPGPIEGGELRELALSEGTRATADAYIFAGGPWLAQGLGGQHGELLRVTRQEVFTFGTPPGDGRFGPGALPVWAFRGERFWYGIPGDGPVGGFKLADDTRGPAFDPTQGERSPSTEELARARSFLADRFPGLAEAPLISSRVCQYTDTPDGHFLADQHPDARNVWIVGGGSGHGFKHGPAVGEHVACLVRGERAVGSDPAFRGFADSGS